MGKFKSFVGGQFHRDSSLYLPWRFSQLSSEILRDVPFPQD